MGERKVLNKYIPPDFDPSKIPRGTRKGGKRNEMKVRMMLPMSICCNTCGNYISKGTKFNSRKEDALGEDYLGIQIFRFFFRCNRCSAEITMKTDPKNSDYTVESGASRNYEPWRDKATQEEEAERERTERRFLGVEQGDESEPGPAPAPEAEPEPAQEEARAKKGRCEGERGGAEGEPVQSAEPRQHGMGICNSEAVG